MEKVNVYDWDKTIFPVDSTVAFVHWCLRRHPGVIWPLLRALALLPGYWHTGKTDGENCHGAEKVRRLHEAYPEVQIAEFYSDSRSDSPLAELAERAYLVHGQERTPW